MRHQLKTSLAAFAMTLSLGGFAAQADSLAAQWLSGAAANGLPELGASEATFRFSSGIPTASPVVKRFEEALDVLRGAGGEAYDLPSFHAGTVHKAYEAFNAARTGISDFAICYSGPVARGFTMSQVTYVPFVMPERDVVAARILADLAPKYFAPEFEAAGVYYGSTIAAGHSHLLSRDPVRSLEDLKGLKIAAFGREVDFVAALGATPTPVPPFDVYTALQQGVIDGVFWTEPAFVAFKLHEVAKNLTYVGGSVVRVDGCVNRRSFDRLPDEARGAIYEWSQAMAAAVTKTAFTDFAPIANKILTEASVELIELDDSERARWVEAGQTVQDAWLASASEQGLPAEELLADIKRLTAFYEPMTDDEIFALTLDEPVTGIIDGM